MMVTTYRGINYGALTASNTDSNGIHYGVIPANDLPSWYDEAKPQYGKPTCPECSSELVETSTIESQLDSYSPYSFTRDLDYACTHCLTLYSPEDAFPESPLAHTIEDADLHAIQHGESPDIFITKSDYYTYAQYCSPCAPGACYLLSPLAEPHKDNRAYCPPIDWFSEESPCPFPVYSVKTNELLYAPTNWQEEKED